MDGTTALVTGASRGLGAAVAREFAAAGAHVVVCARNDSDGLDDVAAEIAAAGGAVTAERADVRDEYDVERLAETAARAGPRSGVDVVVPAAGVYHGDPGETDLADETYAAFDDTLRTNLRGVFATVREAVPHLTAEARVLVPSGPVAREPTPGYGAYAVSKAAAEAAVRQFAAELPATVAVVDPGRVATDLTGGRGRDPADAAAPFAWAATEVDPAELDGGVLDRERWRRATG